MRLSVSSCSLQGIAERPLPCNYNVIQLLQRCPNCGERGSMRGKGIDGRHAEADSLGYSIRERKCVYEDESSKRSPTHRDMMCA